MGCVSARKAIGPYMTNLRQAFRAACQHTILQRLQAATTVARLVRTWQGFGKLFVLHVSSKKSFSCFMLHVTAFQAFHAACHSFVALASLFDKGRILVSR